MNGGFDEWYEIQHKGRRAGVVHIKGEWHPRGEMLVAVPVGQPLPIPPVTYGNGQPVVHVTTKAPIPVVYQQ